MNYFVIVAGGKGLRMGADIPKQFLPVAGRPVLMRTLDTFHSFDPGAVIVLVLPRSQQEYWQDLCKQYAFTVPYMLTDGGETRFHSVRNGVSLLPDDPDGIVAVHDGVRPFVSRDVIETCLQAARSTGAAIPVTDVVETLRKTLPPAGDEPTESRTVDRTAYKLVQTPQAFRLPLLKAAYAQSYRESFTDDASVAEALGNRITLVAGNRENIKITTPFDLHLAEVLAKSL